MQKVAEPWGTVLVDRACSTGWIHLAEKEDGSLQKVAGKGDGSVEKARRLSMAMSTERAKP